jgi:hypothetical protein
VAQVLSGPLFWPKSGQIHALRQKSRQKMKSPGDVSSTFFG